ncbi:hypothetical protein OG279_09495 [Streptomyces sp. NBC_01201]|uniref:hypothetical protein n=1 Tax=Streptomyces sp. NBC_01201 TaxID=2903770 RepID=UPI002E148653|nr:hypothetical protein OG279_09495 [Streptomyces sp. NBC_01201]
MDHTAASNLIFDALAHAVAGNSEKAADALSDLGQNSDNSQMYGVCCAIAGAGEHVLRRIYGDQAPTDGTGMFVLEGLEPGAVVDPPELFALRFLTAYANNDPDTCMALFSAALQSDGDQYVDSVCALLAHVAGLCRLALKR